jgi:hypothetical protein
MTVPTAYTAVLARVCQNNGSPNIVWKLATPVQRRGRGGCHSAKERSPAVRIGPAWKRMKPASHGATSR